MAKLNWFGDKVSKGERKKAGKATWKAAEFLLGEANNTVPHDEGTLEHSGIVTQEKLSGRPESIYREAEAKQWPKNNFKFDFNKKPVFYISYNTPYAIKLHEDTTINFRGQGKAKWLENAIKKNSNKIEKWVAKEMKKG